MTRILLLENDADLSVIAKTTLEDAGYDVDVTSTVAQAIEHTRAQRPDLAVVDLLLDAESGWDYVRWVRKQAGAQRVAAYSVHHDEEMHLARARELNVDALVAKTGDPSDLVRLVAELLQK